jgi:NAD(P)-dependent dehydrogenase (short-subunit alcohol dehydrogenase family)
MESANTQSAAAAGQPRRRLLVTGGGRGIGAAVAVMAARRGWDVAINYARDAAAAERTAAAVRAAGGQALLLQADVADDDAVVAMFAALDAAWGGAGGLHGLVNNAGIVDVAQRVDEYGAARVQRMFAVNVFGSFSCAREAVRRMSTRHGGRGGAIVNIGSVASRLGSAGQYVDYAAAKGAIDVFTLGLSREVATEGVRVNCVRPGITDTEIHASGGQPERARALAPQIPMQRPGTADEIAEAVLWLLSDAAAYTTGALLDVTGGR